MSENVVSRVSSLSERWPLFRLPTLSGATLTAGLVLVIYLAYLPFVERTWRATGDEPHYLLAAHSLIVDGDWDLRNNYAQLDYLAFYFSRDITPQIRLNAVGQQILDHSLALPLLLAPAYAWGGRYGVLLFQALLGGLLAGLTFKLAATISRDETAALVATLAVSLSPPLLFYQYLVYPELIAALLVTLLLYFAISMDRPTGLQLGLALLALLCLPWLNRRFIPLALLLAGLLCWAWRTKPALKTLFRNPGVWGVIVTFGSIFVLAWYNSQFVAPARADIVAPASGSLLGLRLARGVGWLVDQQRGLLIFSPIFALSLWGLPALWRETRQTSSRHWFILLPFLLAWGSTAAAGGYWVAWELGPRFLVVALPGLAPLLALAWCSYHHYKVWLTAAALLLTLSLVNSLVILQNPELPYKSSLPLYYGDRLGLPLTEWLPDLAGYATISASQANPGPASVVTDNGQAVWFAAAERRSPIIPTTTLSELPFGHYQLIWPVRVAPNLSPESDVLRLTANFLGGGQLFNKSVTAGQLPADGSYGRLETQFFNPNVDRWRTSLLLGAESTGLSPVWAADLSLRPTFWFAWVLPYTFLLLLIVVTGATWWAAASPEKITTSTLRRLRLGPGWLSGSVLALLLLSISGYLIYQNRQSGYTYDAETLSHFVGQAIGDPAAEDGRAWRVDPAVDPPQKAIYGPFDFYEPGLYHVTFRIKLPEPVAGDQAVAHLQVNATANFEPLVSQALRPEHFSQVNSYHHFVLIVNNPRRQALSFDVVYTGLATLVIDGVTVERMDGN